MIGGKACNEASRRIDSLRPCLIQTLNGLPLESIAHATPIRWQIAPGPNVKKLIFCSGKVKYDILDAREAAGLKEYGAYLGLSHRSALS
jgi:2-oxoglutarate dehydrogenase complex dehydrogenase (E1) component-like enzyme